MRIVVLGAGPTGLGAAHRLVELGHKDFALYEQTSTFGGLAASHHDDKGFTWDFAVHVAHSHYHYFDRLMEELLPNGFYQHVRKSWVWEYGTYVPYPFQNNIRHLPGDALWDCLRGLLHRSNAPLTDASTFDDWILTAFGEGIADHFLRPYNKKLWCTDTRDMNRRWIGERVPTVDIERILKNICQKLDDVNWGPNAVFDFPKVGGTGAIWTEMGKRLPSGNVHLNAEIVRIDHACKVVHLADGREDRYDHLISTLPLPELAKLMVAPPLQALTSQLRHTQVQVVCVAVPHPIPADLAEKTWLYCPEDNCCFYRVTPFSTFSPAHTPDPDKWCSFLCEVATPPDKKRPSKEEVTRRVLEDFNRSGLMQINPAEAHTLVLESKYGYPVPSIKRDDLLDQIHPWLDPHQIYSRGRFGGWKYEVANMDHSVMQGVECVNRIFLGEEEITYFQPHIVNAGKR